MDRKHNVAATIFPSLHAQGVPRFRISDVLVFKMSHRSCPRTPRRVTMASLTLIYTTRSLFRFTRVTLRNVYLISVN